MRKISIVILVFVIGTLFSSCMMMMPGHMSASMHEDHNANSSGAKIDPVCGKQVGEKEFLTYEYQKSTYYFDTEQCLSVFKSDPEHFLRKPEKETPHKRWAKVGWIGGSVVMVSMMVLMLTNVF
jgi:YHS domain-containing protein